jgi:hypothetical protein
MQMNRAVHFPLLPAAKFHFLQSLTIWHQGCFNRPRESGPKQEGRPREDKTMKNLTMRLTIAVATLAAAAVSASAQTYKADVPMAFHAGRKLMAAGTYDFVVLSKGTGQKTVVIRSRSAKDSALLVTVPGSDAPKAWRDAGSPKISFNCAGTSCSLTRLYNGSDDSAYQFPSPKVAPGEKERMASITLSLVRTE